MTRDHHKPLPVSPLRQPRDLGITEVGDSNDITPETPPPPKPVATPKGPDRPERPTTAPPTTTPRRPIRGA